MFCLVGCVFLDRMSGVFLAPLYLRDLHLSNLEVGGIVAALSVGWGLSASVFGALSDRVGRRRVLIPAVFVFSLISSVTSLVQSFGQFFVARLLMGASEGAAFSPMTAILAAESKPSRRGLNIGIALSAVSLIGVALAPVLTTQLAARYGWRPAFLLAAVPGFIVGLVLVVFLREPRADALERAPTGWAGLRLVLRTRNIVVSIATGTLFGAWIAIMSVFGPLFLTGAYRLPVTVMGALVGLSGLGGFLGSILIPALSDRFGRRPAASVAFLLLGGSSLLLVLIGPNPLLIGLTWWFFSLGQGASPLIGGVIPTESLPMALGATAVAVPAFALETVGGTTGPVLAGAAADAFGAAAPLWIAGGLALAAALVSLLYAETAPRRTKPAGLATTTQ